LDRILGVLKWLRELLKPELHEPGSRRCVVNQWGFGSDTDGRASTFTKLSALRFAVFSRQRGTAPSFLSNRKAPAYGDYCGYCQLKSCCHAIPKSINQSQSKMCKHVVEGAIASDGADSSELHGRNAQRLISRRRVMCKSWLLSPVHLKAG
jgi:hypothetical protein